MDRKHSRGWVYGICLLVCSAAMTIAATCAIIRTPPPELFSQQFPTTPQSVRPARFARGACAGVQCGLCPFNCFLPEGARGRCRVRMNTGGRLQTLVYGQAAAVHVDPIEKKPVYHLLPGTKTFSIATVGCNLRCTFCQNWTLSQEYPERVAGTPLAPADVVAHALVQGCRSIAYTYSEPVVFFEYVIDTAQAARTAGLKNILVSAGYINPEPLDELLALCDCVKIDLKGFQGSFYRDYVSGDVRHVLRTLQAVRTHGVLLEVVNLVVPTLNDSPGDLRALARWVRSELGSDTPLFFSRFSPHYRLTNLSPTPRETLDLAYTIAKEEDLRYVYVGNVPGHPGENTVCPGCGKIIIGRYGYFVTRYALKGSRCFYCGMTIPGSWDETTAQMTRPWIRTQSEVLAQ